MADKLTPQEAGARLKRLRIDAEWSAIDLAEKIRLASRESGGVEHPLTQQAVSKFENGGLKSIPRWYDLALRLLGQECPSDDEVVAGEQFGLIVSADDLERILSACLPRARKQGYTAKEAGLLARAVLSLLPNATSDHASLAKRAIQVQGGKSKRRPPRAKPPST